MDHDDPTVSVIIVNYNGRSFLPNCLECLEGQVGVDFETIIVDNGSTDGSVEFIRQAYPGVKLRVSDTNLGFAGGNNLGLASAEGEYILLLNTDAYLQPDSLVKLVRTVEHDGPDVVQPRLVLTGERGLDACGSYFTGTGFLNHIGLYAGIEDAELRDGRDVFSVKGACMLCRRGVIKDVGLFDDDYFMYFEESDFCHRAWLAGYRCSYVPVTDVRHEMGGTAADEDEDISPELQFHSYKNRIRSYLKNLGRRRLLTIVPFHVVLVFLIGLLQFANGRTEYGKALIGAIGWNIRHIGSTLSKRRRIQTCLRKRPDSAFLPQVTRTPDIKQYIDGLRNQL